MNAPIKGNASFTTEPSNVCLRALIFDVDGTLADTEEMHRQAFNAAFRALGFDAQVWDWDVRLYQSLLKVSGGKERIRAYAASLTDKANKRLLDDATLNKIHQLKTEFYLQSLKTGQIVLRTGVRNIITEAVEAGCLLAIATTTSRENVEELLAQHFGNVWQALFPVVEDASTVSQKKPHAQVYHQVLARLKMSAHTALAFEDSRNGLEAAHAAGLACVVTPCQYTACDDVSEADWLLPSLEGITFTQLQVWQRERLNGSRMPK